jgi:hypothetical protein
MGGEYSTYGRQERVLGMRCEGKRALERPGLRWEDYIKWIFKKWDG